MVSRSATAVFLQVLTVLITTLTADTFPVSVVGLMFLVVMAVLVRIAEMAWSFRLRSAMVLFLLVSLVLISSLMMVICLVSVVRSSWAVVMILASIVVMVL